MTAIDIDFVRARCAQMRSRIGPRADHDWALEERIYLYASIERRVEELLAEALAGQHSAAVIEHDCCSGGEYLVDDLVHLLTTAHDQTWAGEDRLDRMHDAWRRRCEAWARWQAEREFGP